MKRYRKLTYWCSAAITVVCGLAAVVAGGGETDPAALRQQAQKLMNAGNYKDAYEQFAKLALDPADSPEAVGNDLTCGVQCLNNLGRPGETDAFREKVIATHAKNWRLLLAAARSLQNDNHYGSMVAGAFVRGPHRGGTAKWANAYERDRVRAMQLMDQGVGVIEADPQAADGRYGEFYLELGRMLMGNRGWNEAWRLQYLSDLTQLPDYEDGYGYNRGGSRGAPVNPDGSPVYHSLPKSWPEARTDGERYRWAIERGPAQGKFEFATFLQQQFGVASMAEYGWFFNRSAGTSDDDTRKDESGTWELHTLKTNETIAKLAMGIKRFAMPAEFDFIRRFQLITETKDGLGELALASLAQEFENRRQYDTAVTYWRRSIEQYGDDRNNHWKQQRLDQILKNWGTFEPVMAQPAGSKGATVDFRFRNAGSIHFEATEINVPKLLDDVKAYLKTKPKQLDWEKLDISNLGWRLVEKNQTQYLGAKAGAWDLELKPRPNHWDRRITVQTPLRKAGAYLLTGTLADGNVSRIILWVADTALVKKAVEKAPYLFVADAVSGKPVPNAALDFFGYRQEWKNNAIEIYTREKSGKADADGQYFQAAAADDSSYQWVITATTPEGRFAYLGFTGVWWNNYADQEYNQTKVYVITDRPVYRPEQPVKFKFWVNQAQYDQDGKSPYAGQTFTVRVNNPKGEKIVEKQLAADTYGGFDGEFTLSKDATLGVYQILLPRPENQVSGSGSFRLEEYKKPEFEVTVQAPNEPVMLGEKITAKIQAKYYFGAPVTEATVKYKIMRTDYSANWYPVCTWDWFYNPGYWWFAYDYNWYPGWADWGCRRPVAVWWQGWRQPQPPEIVAEAEVPVGKDGTVSVEIDTAVAKAMHPDTDHRYQITAEVRDQSRRTIVGTGQVLVARKPFKVYAWVDRGHYRAGDAIEASFKAQTLDNKPVAGKGELKLFKITYDKDGKPQEERVEKWKLPTDAQGEARLQIKAAAPGQYRLSYTVTDSQGHSLEGGYVFGVMGEGLDSRSKFRFNDIELVTDKKEYAPGDQVRLRVNTARADGTVLLFIRPSNGTYQLPRVLRLQGMTAEVAIEVQKKDMPNFFVEALTVSGGQVYSEMREIIVPPEKRVLNVEVKPTKDSYKPGEKAEFNVKLTDAVGAPFSGSTVVAVYDKSVEYVSGGSNVADIKEFFWKWRRSHNLQRESSLDKGGQNIVRSGEPGMGFLGVFGAALADEDQAGLRGREVAKGGGVNRRAENSARGVSIGGMALASAPSAPMAADALGRADRKADGNANGMMLMEQQSSAQDKRQSGAQPPSEQGLAQPTVRSNFADTALWIAALQTDIKGEARVTLTMPENLTTWKTRVWAMGDGAKVGEGAAEVVTAKNLIIRLQAPRFFVQKDEVVLSANVHNYLKNKKQVKVVLELEGGTLAPLDAAAPPANGIWSLEQAVTVEPKGEKRVDFRVRVTTPGTALVRMKALTDEESDAMQMSFPAYVHGMLKTDSYSGVIRPDKDSAFVTVRVPAERLPEQSRLEVRYSPTLAGAMVDALPYLVDYPYGCTEQTLNRFLPTVITQHILLRMGLDLKDIQKKQSNLNAQEIGDDKTRAADWKRNNPPNPGTERNPVFDTDTVKDMVKSGIERLTSMQCSDGGWGWFSGWGEHSWPHTTAVVVHGLQIARDNDVAVPDTVLQRGVDWLKGYQADQVRRLKLPPDARDYKAKADDLDALVYMVLVDEKADHPEMRDLLYRDRNHLAVYSKAILGLACHKVGDLEKRDMLQRNVEQYLIQDNENQTAYLQLPEGNCWWYWYGSEYEAQAYYLKLLALVEPKGEKASRLVKYLINNRKHSSYWNSTRDTAVVLEAFADYIKASGEDQPDMTVQLLIDGKPVKEVKISKENLFSFDNKLILEGAAVAAGEHKIEFRRTGKGPLYFNAYLTNFTLEDPITRAGLEIKVNRKFYKLTAVDKKIKVEGVRGQALNQKVEKFERTEIPNLGKLKSGDLIEVELELDSKNDYEYIVFEDMKAAGTEPVDVRSGYNGNEMGTYVEFRDERVVFFIRALARGKHSVSYRLRAEIPGKFSALPTRGSAMYAPELKANSDEWKLQIAD